MLTIIFFYADYIMKILSVMFVIIALTIITLSVDTLIEFLEKNFSLGLKVELCDSQSSFGKVTLSDILSWFFGIGLTIVWCITNHWILSNLIGICYTLQVLRIITIRKYYVVTMFLVLLFFFDIYWVFFSSNQFGKSVMLVAATKIDLPIKIVCPHIFATPFKSCSLLGLGDMALPGMAVKFFAFADDRLKTGRFYHTVSMIGYACALLCCILVLL